MPKTTSKEEAALAKISANGQGPDYVNCDLNPAQKRELDAFIEGGNQEDLFQWIVGRIIDNHVMSVRCNEIGYQCSLTGGKAHASHSNKCLISRSSTPERSMWSVMFKDTTLLHGIWPVTNRLEDLD